MMQALSSFAQLVYGENHLDKEMETLIAQLDTYEWKHKDLGKLRWMSEVEYKSIVNLQLTISITDEDGDQLHRGDEFPTWTSYLMKVEFSNLNKFSDSPLCKAFYGLFKHSYVLETQSDIEEAKRLLVDMVKFFKSPLPESEDIPLELAS